MQAKQLGLSLVELMIAVTLGIVLMTGVVNMFLSSKVVFTTQQGMSRIQETGRLAIDFLSRDIRMAAYYGCYRPVSGNIGADLQNKNLVISGLHGNFGEGVRGYDSIASLPGGKNDVGSALTLLSADKTANVIVVRAANEVGFPISAANDPTRVFAYSPNALVDGCADGLCPNAAAVISDCFKARVFRVNSVSLSGTTLTIEHADTWGGGTNPLENFTTGELLPMNTTTYFLAQGASGAPSLWQKSNDESALELLEGVEHMRITYATSNDPDDYRLASALAASDWPNVFSVRLELVVRSIENNVLEEAQPYTFAGAEVIPAAAAGIPDRYLRQVFTSTIGIRSRATNLQ